jgi:heterodisulfide reductase subunit A
VAACTPRTHEPLFRDTLREAGINQYYFDMANIREHCSWVHSLQKETANVKAKEIIRMAAARVCHLEPLQEFDLPVNKKALVLGGGVAGMTCALSIARQGHEVYLVEKEKELGGNARNLYSTLEGADVQSYLKDLISQMYKNRLIHILTGATVLEAGGYIGNFFTKVKSGAREYNIEHGVSVIATGVDLYKPDEYLYGKDDRVFTHLELEGQIANGNEKITKADSIVMIQCVGCRNDDRNYCSRVCCSEAIKNALKLKETNPDMDIYIIFRDIRTYGLKEDYYKEAAGKNVRFIRYESEDPPVVEAGTTEDGKPVLKVLITDPVLDKKLELDASVVSLAAAVVPASDRKEISTQFKVSLGPDEFFQEAHVKLRPVDFAADGVFLCGTAHYPKFLPETISQAYGAAGRALTLLSHDTVTASGSVCAVDEDKCISCGACITACAYGAIEFYESPKGRKAKVNSVLCKGDGICNAKCPTEAIYLKHYTEEALASQIDAAFASI